MTDITKMKVTVGVFCACLIFVGSSGFKVAMEIADLRFASQKTDNSVSIVRSDLAVLNTKLDMYNAQSWTWLMEQNSWKDFTTLNPGIEKPDVRQIWKDHSK